MTYEITKVDIAAMRKADIICFRHSNGKSQIEAVKKMTEKELQKNPFQTEIRIDIACDYRLHDYDKDKISSDESDSYRKGNNFKAFEMLHSAQYTETWITIASLLKAGDALTLFWVRDGKSNGLCVEAGLHGDELIMIITRDAREMHFSIDTSISLNNSARMIHKIR